jgi:hypothetical protein
MDDKPYLKNGGLFTIRSAILAKAYADSRAMRLHNRGTGGIRNMTTEAEQWLTAQPKNTRGKVDILLVVMEGVARGYCICPKPLREMVNFQGLRCSDCLQLETQGSYDFWYKAT